MYQILHFNVTIYHCILEQWQQTFVSINRSILCQGHPKHGSVIKLNTLEMNLDLYLEFDDSGQLSTKIYGKRDAINFKIIHFQDMCSNIPASPAYGAYISQLIRYAGYWTRTMKRFALFDLLKIL